VITNSDVVVRNVGGAGAGIGAGTYESKVTDIIITNSNVDVRNQGYGSGIGSGYYDAASTNIRIAGSSIYSLVMQGGRTTGAGIGGGIFNARVEGNIDITDSIVQAESIGVSDSSYSAGIGSGNDGPATSPILNRYGGPAISMTNSFVVATGGTGIGASRLSDVYGGIAITGCTVIAKATGQYAQDIGYYSPNYSPGRLRGDITIDGGNVFAANGKIGGNLIAGVPSPPLDPSGNPLYLAEFDALPALQGGFSLADTDATIEIGGVTYPYNFTGAIALSEAKYATPYGYTDPRGGSTNGKYYFYLPKGSDIGGTTDDVQLKVTLANPASATGSSLFALVDTNGRPVASPHNSATSAIDHSSSLKTLKPVSALNVRLNVVNANPGAMPNTLTTASFDTLANDLTTVVRPGATISSNQSDEAWVAKNIDNNIVLRISPNPTTPAAPQDAEYLMVLVNGKQMPYDALTNTLELDDITENTEITVLCYMRPANTRMIALDVGPGGSAHLNWQGTDRPGIREGLVYFLVPSQEAATFQIAPDTDVSILSVALDGTAITLQPNAGYIPPSTTDQVLTVRFIPTALPPTLAPIEHTVTYYANGGKNPSGGEAITDRAKEGEPYTLLDNPFTRDGYTFGGWNTLADGTGTDYLSKEQITSFGTKDLEFYAKWLKIGTSTVVDDTENDGGTPASTPPASDTPNTPSSPSSTSPQTGDRAGLQLAMLSCLTALIGTSAVFVSRRQRSSAVRRRMW
jgi:uncharacterized repeat protein (TIGR02543 family)